VKEPDCERRTETLTIVIGGAVLTPDEAAGRTCCYCPLTFGRLDPVQAPAGVEGVLFLAAHRSCIGPSTWGPHTEGQVAASGRRERSRDD
jgi:hypothetical protein